MHTPNTQSPSQPKTTNPSSHPHQLPTLEILSDLLTDICEENTGERDTNPPTLIKPFLSKSIPAISIKNFFERIVKYTKIENSTLILILVYIDRLCDKQKFRLNYFNIHKIIISTMIIAIKYNEDEYFDQNFYSKVGGITIKELQKLEHSILTLLNFDLFVNETLFNKYYNYIQSVTIAHDNNNEDYLYNDTKV
jgi:hypothetical protein